MRASKEAGERGLGGRRGSELAFSMRKELRGIILARGLREAGLKRANKKVAKVLERRGGRQRLVVSSETEEDEGKGGRIWLCVATSRLDLSSSPTIRG